MRIGPTLLIGALPLLTTRVALAGSAPERRLAQALDAFVEKALASDLAPGLAIAVVEGDKRVYARGFGYADRAAKRPVTPETAFYVASTTKSFTALAAALLHERKAIDLDAPMVRYLKGVRLQPPLSADAITLRDLLTHTHGISNDGPVVFRTAYSGDFTNPLLLELLAEHPPAEKGRAFAYGNLGYVVAGLALESALGGSGAPTRGGGWKEIVQREVFDPLKMTSTTAWRSRVPADQLAMPHAATGQGFRRLPETKTDANMHAAGGHFSTVLDLARYLQAQLGDGRIEGRPVLSATALAETRRRQADQDRAFGEIRRVGWGLGWDLGRLDGELLLHRFGGFPGYRSHLSFMPERHLGVAVLVNENQLGGRLADLVAAYAYELLLGRAGVGARYEGKLQALRDEAGKAREKMAQEAAARAARPQQLPHPLEAYAGVYESRRLGRLELRVVGGRLEARMGVLSSPVEVFDGRKNALRVELTGSGSVLEAAFPAGEGPASRLTFEGEAFDRTGP